MFNISGVWNNLSYGIVNRNITRKLYEHNHKVALFPIGGVENIDQDILGYVISNQISSAQNKHSLRIFHQFDLASRIGKGLHFGYPVFELDNFTALEKAHLNHCDGIIVTSKWAKSIVEQHFSGPIIVAPLGVDTSIFQPKKLISNRPKTIFLNIGKWELRKCHDILPKIFDAAFTEKDNVELRLFPTNIFCNQEENANWIKLYTQSKLAHKIKLLERVADNDLCLEMNRATCGFYPNKAEGFNFSALEIMACGKPLIISNHTAQTEFCQTSSNYLVRHTETEPAYDGKFFLNDGQRNTGNWWKFGKDEFDQCVHYMRLVHQKNMESPIDICDDNIEQAKRFSWNSCVKNIIEGINK